MKLTCIQNSVDNRQCYIQTGTSPFAKNAAPVWEFSVSIILSNELVKPAEDFVVPLETISVV